jgi:hypothetical protein
MRAMVRVNAPAAACQNTMTDTKKARPRDMMFLSTPFAERRARRWRKDYSQVRRATRKLAVHRLRFLFFVEE